MYSQFYLVKPFILDSYFPCKTKNYPIVYQEIIFLPRIMTMMARYLLQTLKKQWKKRDFCWRCLDHVYQKQRYSANSPNWLKQNLKGSILSSPSLQIWHSLVWSQTLLSLYILSLKFLIQSHSINYHVFASESQIFTSCPKLSSRFQICISYYSPSSCISHRFLKFNTFITKLIFFSRNLCFLSQMLHHHPASQYWKLRDTLTLLFPSPSSIPGAKIPLFLGISQIYFPNISRNIPFSLLLD